MNETIKWKGEVTFEGTEKQFQEFQAVLEKQPVNVTMAPELLTLGRRAGYYGFVEQLTALPEAQIAKLSEGGVSIQYSGIKGIAGGIRTPHLHVEGKVVLVDKERFKTILGEAARNAFK